MGWGEFEWDPEQLPNLKLGLHVAQMLFAFIIFCLEISVFRTADSLIVGNNGWPFAVCFLSIPAWIYLCMAPRFPRTRKLAHPHAMAAVDGAFCIFWLSAFAAQAAYNTANFCGSACGQSKAIVGFGFFVFLFFCGTTFLSLYTVKYFEWNNRLPGYDKVQINSQNIDPDKAAFSMAPHDEEAYAHVPMNDHDNDHHAGPPHHDDRDYDNNTTYGGASSSHVGSYHEPENYGDPRRESYGHQDAGYGGGVGAGTSPAENPFRQDNPFDSDNEYQPNPATAVGRPYAPPTAHDDYDDDRPVQFPAANYDRVIR